MTGIPGRIRDNSQLYRIVRKYRDPITGLIDWDAVNREYDYIDFHTSPFVANQFNTITQLDRSTGVSPQSCASQNEIAWSIRQLEAGIPESGVLGRLS